MSELRGRSSSPPTPASCHAYLAAGPLADASSTETVVVGGSILLTATVLALGLVPRETRTLCRAEHAGRSASKPIEPV